MRIFPSWTEPVLKRTAPFAVLLALMALLAAHFGCSLLSSDEPIRLDISARTYPVDDYTAIKRVLILPFTNETDFQGRETIVQRAFAQECAERACFEVVLPAQGDAKLFKGIDPSRTGRFSIETLIELGSCYRVDAVLLGTLKIYNPYNPPSIGLKADLISVHDGNILRSVTGLLDAREAMVNRDIAVYYAKNCSAKTLVFEEYLITASPDWYARYACHRFVGALYPEIGG